MRIYINEHRGLVQLYRHTGQEDVLDQAIALRNWILANKAWVSGGVPEWFDPPDWTDPIVAGNEDALFFEDVAPLARLRDETCTTGDWMMLNLELGQVTADDAYLETAEHIFWNHFLAGQADNGGWCGHRDLTGMAGEVWDFCCSHHGPRCLIEAMRHALVRYADGLRLNLHMPVQTRFTWPGCASEAKVEFNPTKSRYTIHFQGQTHGEFPVRLRRPTWAEDMRVQAPGKDISDKSKGDIVVRGQWHSGDRIVCTYRPRVCLRPDATPPADRIALQKGPLLLAAISATTPPQDTVKVSTCREENIRRVTINLEGRFAAAVGLCWVDPHCIDWDHPDHGVQFRFYVDGTLLQGSSSAPVQGCQGSQVIGLDVKGCKELVLEVHSTHPHFPQSAGHFTSLRLFTADGKVAYLDLFLKGGHAPIMDLSTTKGHFKEVLSAATEQWPLWVVTEAASFSLLPMKDLLVLVRPEGTLGHNAPIAHSDFTVLLPYIQSAGNNND